MEVGGLVAERSEYLRWISDWLVPPNKQVALGDRDVDILVRYAHCVAVGVLPDNPSHTPVPAVLPVATALEADAGPLHVVLGEFDDDPPVLGDGVEILDHDPSAVASHHLADPVVVPPCGDQLSDLDLAHQRLPCPPSPHNEEAT